MIEEKEIIYQEKIISDFLRKARINRYTSEYGYIEKKRQVWVAGKGLVDIPNKGKQNERKEIFG